MSQVALVRKRKVLLALVAMAPKTPKKEGKGKKDAGKTVRGESSPTQASGPRAPNKSTPAAKEPALPGRFAVGTPVPTSDQSANPPSSKFLDWAVKAGISDLLESLEWCGLHTVEEVGALRDEDLSALFVADPGIPIGSRARLRLAIEELRGEAEPHGVREEPSGWVEEESGTSIPLGLLHGFGPDETIFWENLGVGAMCRPGRGWVRIRLAVDSPVRPGGREREVEPFVTPPVSASAPPPVSSGFGAAGPLEEMVANARQILRQVGGSEANSPNLCPPTPISPSMAPVRQFVPAAAPFAPTPTAAGGGHLLSGTVTRAPARPVSLKVTTRQAAAIEEEWTSAGTVRFETAVANRSWKDGKTMRTAFALARAFDVAKESGLDLATEPWAEIQLRELAAMWYADRHPTDLETAEFLRESPMSQFGIPRGLWQEAREFRKLVASKSTPNA